MVATPKTFRSGKWQTHVNLVLHVEYYYYYFIIVNIINIIINNSKNNIIAIKEKL